MVERRRAPRLRSLKGAQIEFSPYWPVIDCTIRNLSAGGACVEMAGLFNAPLKFELIFMQDQSKRACRQVWRRDNRIGVEFH